MRRRLDELMGRCGVGRSGAGSTAAILGQRRQLEDRVQVSLDHSGSVTRYRHESRIVGRAASGVNLDGSAGVLSDLTDRGARLANHPAHLCVRERQLQKAHRRGGRQAVGCRWIERCQRRSGEVEDEFGGLVDAGEGARDLDEAVHSHSLRHHLQDGQLAAGLLLDLGAGLAGERKAGFDGHVELDGEAVGGGRRRCAPVHAQRCVLRHPPALWPAARGTVHTVHDEAFFF